MSSEVCDAAMSSSDSASAEDSSGHSGKVRRLLLLDNGQGDEGRRALKQRQCEIIRTNQRSSVNGSGFIEHQDKEGMSLLGGRHFLCRDKVYTSHSTAGSRSDLLLSVRLPVSTSDVGPLLVFAASIAILTSSIHFCISVKELRGEMTTWVNRSLHPVNETGRSHGRTASWSERVR